MVRRTRQLVLVLVTAGAAAGCGLDVRPKWIRDPDGRKWDEPRDPYLGGERDAAAEPHPLFGSMSGHA